MIDRLNNNRTDRRAGLTLIELLVVGTIIMILTVVSLPIVKPMLDSQLTKNGAQIVSTYLNRAKNRAMLTGRSCGVRFEVWEGTEVSSATDEILQGIATGNGVYYYGPGASLVIRQVEVPPVYSGMFGSATVNVNGNRCNFNDDNYVRERLKGESGAKIQIGDSGPFYSFENKSVKLEDSDIYPLLNRDGVTYKILFAPKTTMAAPITLPRGATVDLQFSGPGNRSFGYNTANDYDADGNPIYKGTDMTIMFAPDGSVESVNNQTPTEPIHFLVGRWDQISVVRASGDTQSFPNYADGRNFWVTVHPQSGTVAINPVNPINAPTDKIDYVRLDGNNEPDAYLEGYLANSRALTH